MILLFVDDDELGASGIAWILEDDGFTVHRATRGRDVVPLARDVRPDVVILDVTLPYTDGVAVARALREHWPELPIVFTTGHDEAYEGLRAAVDGGPARLLHKPYPFEALVHAIHELASRA